MADSNWCLNKVNEYFQGTISYSEVIKFFKNTTDLSGTPNVGGLSDGSYS